MESVTVYDFTNYKQYLRREILSRPRKGRGMKSALAQAASCQSAYFSRILADQAELSLEQADAISVYLGHSEPETHYFLLCVQLARAGTERLRASFRKQLEGASVLKREDLKRAIQSPKRRCRLRTRPPTTAPPGFLHRRRAYVRVRCRRLPRARAMAAHLGVSTKRISEITEFLQGCGMLRHEGGRYRLGNARVHLGADSPLISKHHANWRIQAIRSLLDRDAHEAEGGDLHYTSIVSLSTRGP